MGQYEGVSTLPRVAYDEPGPLTQISAGRLAATKALPDDPIGLCRAAQRLVILPEFATAAGVPDERQEERSLRSIDAMLDVILTRNPAPLEAKRELQERVVGTCRHYSVMSCAFLRLRGIPARSRCGFATYFQPGQYLDHWITEYWHAADARWVRVDSEILGFLFVEQPDDLAPGQFLTGGEAWRLCRDGADPQQFGVHGVDYAWGIAEVRGNAIRDLAALNKVEMLPWDEWGRMHASYEGETGADYDDLMDVIAGVTGADRDDAIQDLYASADLAVPTEMIA
jgi:hypothetical protein